MRLGNLKSLKPRIFKFEEGQIWDGDEAILEYIFDLLLDYNDCNQAGCPKVKQKTYITIQCAKEVSKKWLTKEIQHYAMMYCQCREVEIIKKWEKIKKYF